MADERPTQIAQQSFSRAMRGAAFLGDPGLKPEDLARVLADISQGLDYLARGLGQTYKLLDETYKLLNEVNRKQGAKNGFR